MQTIYMTLKCNLLPCPLCGEKVQLKLSSTAGIAILGAPIRGEQFSLRGKIKCPNCYLTLDLGQDGIKDGADLTALMQKFGDEVAERWNRRAEI